MNTLDKLIFKINKYIELPSNIDSIQQSLGRIESKLNQNYYYTDDLNLHQLEFKVQSQWGEDGIIDFILSKVEIPNKVFVEFGVETYTEANTIFLLKNRGWSGLIIDGSKTNVDKIKYSDVFWKYDLKAVCSFITKDNINSIIGAAGVGDDIGILSIDIDGNDYWVWDAIKIIQPRIVICEYNSLFGESASISIPYKEGFYRTAEHSSRLYYGASIQAFNFLAEKKGYKLIAGNSAGNNLFFIREDCLGELTVKTPKEIYVRAGFREARDKNGELIALDFDSRRMLIKDMVVVDVVKNKEIKLEKIINNE